eukprot:16689-Heterococcus_DN1.PRE.7
MHSTQINLVAVDFDMTMVDVHTGGRWQSGEAELAQRIRPFFRAFIPKAAEHGLHVAVVTFSEQTKLIRSVLRAAFGKVIAANIVVRGSDATWSYEGVGSKAGKQQHIASAVEELTMTFTTLRIKISVLCSQALSSAASNSQDALSQRANSGTTVFLHAHQLVFVCCTQLHKREGCVFTRASTLLVDDDVGNVRTALNAGVHAVWCNPHDVHTMLEFLCTLSCAIETTRVHSTTTTAAVKQTA